MAKLIPVTNVGGAHAGYMFDCPGCGHSHVFSDKWQFNGDLAKPTFTPSLMNRSTRDKDFVCHLFLRDGVIEFCGDCTHALAGQSVPCPEFEAEP